MTDSQPGPSKPATDRGKQPGGPVRALWAGSGSSRRIVLIVSAACLCVAAAGVTVAVLSSPGSPAGHIAAGSSPAAKATQPQAGQPAAPAASSPAVAGAKVTSNGVAKSALRWPPRLNNQIQRWREGPGGSYLASVTSQMGAAMQAAGVKQYGAMRMTCTTVASEVRAAQAGPPIPDAAMQRLYAKALAGLSSAAADCRQAISEHPEGDEDLEIHLNHALLDQARLEFAAASKKLYRATAEISS
jgi:hypothetical protein